jgi:phage terminase large subunit-like protein
LARAKTAVVDEPTDVIRGYYRRLLAEPARLPTTRWGITAIGPTWRIGEDGRWVLPERTLGWDVLEWCGVWLQHPDGSPWRFTGEQARFILWWYAIDETGRFLFRDAVLQRMKGWGKDPLAAALMMAELVGPVRFGGWRDDGEPVAVDVGDAWVQTAAVSLDQTKNTMRLLPSLVSRDARYFYRIQIGKETVYALDDSRFLQAVTRSPASLEGARATFVVLNETHLWQSNNDGHEMAAVIARNAAKVVGGGARTLRITNAYTPGEDSVAERDREAWEAVQSGRAVDVGLLYDSLEAPPLAPLTADAAAEVCMAVRGDSWWLDAERLVAEVLDVRNPPSQSRRWWYNQIVAAEDSWVSRQQWDACAAPDAPPVEDGQTITMGFDGGRTDDWTALVGCRVDDGLLFTIGLWNPEKYGGEIPRDEIDGTIQLAMERYDVVGFFADVHPWESYVDRWTEQYGHSMVAKVSERSPIGWDMRARKKETVEAVERMEAAIVDREVKHTADPVASSHVYNARRRVTGFGVTIQKDHRESARKIDWAMAAVLAWAARRAYLAMPERVRRRRHRRARGKVVFV